MTDQIKTTALDWISCPAEETLVGKVFMVRDGVFNDLDACLGHHPGGAHAVSLGSSNAMNSVRPGDHNRTIELFQVYELAE